MAIGRTSATYMLHIGSSTNNGDVMIGVGALCVDDNDSCAAAPMDDGTVYGVNVYSRSADYAEYFYSEDIGLEPGELVCVDIAKDGAVKRCQNPRDGNLMGIVSTKPAFIGNATDITMNSDNYKMIGMLGQLTTKASNENGPIRPGDSLTSASVPGYAMKASAGDPTVGVALQALDAEKGTINVLVSRRNKSLTVAQVEEAVVERIAEMEIEDEVAILVSDAVDSYNFDPVVSEIIGGELTSLEESFNLELSQKIADLEGLMASSTLSVQSSLEGKLSEESNELRSLIEQNKLDLIEESLEQVDINTNLTVSGALDIAGGLSISGDISSLGNFEVLGDISSSGSLSLENSMSIKGVLGASTTKQAFKVLEGGEVVSYKDLVFEGQTRIHNIQGITDLAIADSNTLPSDSFVIASGSEVPARVIFAKTESSLYIISAKDASILDKQDIIATTTQEIIGAIFSTQEEPTSSDETSGSSVIPSNAEESLIQGTKDDFGAIWQEAEITAYDEKYNITAISSENQLFIETSPVSVKDALSVLGAEHVVNTNLSVNQDLEVGESLIVYGSKDSEDTRPTFQVAPDGTITVRDDIVFSSQSYFEEIANITDTYLYNTSKDPDAGAWARQSQFPSQAIIVASDDEVRIYDARETEPKPWAVITGFIGEDSAQSGEDGTTADSSDTTTDSEGSVQFKNISSIYAKAGILYIACDTGIYSMNISDPSHSEQISSIQSANSMSGAIINSKPYLAVASDSLISLINLSDMSSAEIGYQGARGVWLTGAGDIYTASDNSVSVITKAHLKEFGLSVSYQYTASSTPQLAIKSNITGLRVTENTSVSSETGQTLGNTIYAASESSVFKISENKKDKELSRVEEIETGLENIMSMSIDEDYGIIYLTSEKESAKISMLNGQELEKIDSIVLEDGSSVPALGASDILGYGDVTAIATPEGLAVNIDEYSLRERTSGAASQQPQGQKAGRISVSDEAEFSGRVVVKDTEDNPVFAIDERTGEILAREDMLFSGDSKMSSLSSVSQVYVYNTSLDKDGGAWRFDSAISREAGVRFPQKAIIALANEYIYIYNANTKDLYTRVEDKDGRLSEIGNIIGITAKGGEIRVYGSNGSLARVLLSFDEDLGKDSDLSSDQDEEPISIIASQFTSITEPIVSVTQSAEGGVYYATQNAVFNEGEDTEEMLLSPDRINDIAVSNNMLYIAHNTGINAINIKTRDYFILEQTYLSGSSSNSEEPENWHFTLYRDTENYIPSTGATIIESIAVSKNNNLLVSSKSALDNQFAVAEISSRGTILDIWIPQEPKQDSTGTPYSAQEVISAHTAGNVFAIATKAQTSDEFIWMETRGFSLKEELNAPKQVFTVTDQLYAPRITSTIDNLDIAASTTISFFTGNASSTPALIVKGDKVGIGTTTPESKLSISGSNTQLSLSYNDIASADFAMSEDGVLTITNAAASQESESDKSIFAFARGRLGIGTDKPTSALDIQEGNIELSDGFGIGTEENPQMIVFQDGKIGIGTNAPASSLHIATGGLCVGTDEFCEGYNEDGTLYAMTTAAAEYDLAENYPTRDETIVAGEIVMLGGQDGAFVERSDSYSKALGIVSPKPGMLLGGFGAEQYKDEHQVAVALAGRVPVKVSLENGPIERGDYLTLSEEIPGVAAKLEGSGQVIGIALQDYDGSPVQPIYDGQPGKQIMTFINMFYHYDDTETVRMFDNKIIDIQSQIDELRRRVEDLEQWRVKIEE